MSPIDSVPELLLERARTGDEAALGPLLELYRNYLRLVARTLIGQALRVRLPFARWISIDPVVPRAILPHTNPARGVQNRRSQVDADLAGLRDPAAVGKLPEDERKACRTLWVEVDALLAKAGGVNNP